MRELGISRLDAWKYMRLAEIPKEQFDRLLAEGINTTNGLLRAAGKLSPDRPRPAERGRQQAIEHLEAAMDLIDRLRRTLLETGSEEEIALATDAWERTLRALRALCVPVRSTARFTQA